MVILFLKTCNSLSFTRLVNISGGRYSILFEPRCNLSRLTHCVRLRGRVCIWLLQFEVARLKRRDRVDLGFSYLEKSSSIK